MDGESKPTAAFLQARIVALQEKLNAGFLKIVAAGHTIPAELPSHTTTGANDGFLPPSYVDTAAEQLKLDVESTALVRAAEEIMVLTRSMKDLWLFGGLDTLRGERSENKEGDAKMREDINIVREAVRRNLASQREDNTQHSGSDEKTKSGMEVDVRI